MTDEQIAAARKFMEDARSDLPRADLEELNALREDVLALLDRLEGQVMGVTYRAVLLNPARGLRLALDRAILDRRADRHALAHGGGLFGDLAPADARREVKTGRAALPRRPWER